MKMRSAAAVTAALLCLLTVACESQPTRLSRIGLHRVCVVPPWNETQYPKGADRFADCLVSELSRLTAGTNIVVASRNNVPGLDNKNAMLHGSIPLDTLVEARKRYRADALLVGSFDRYNPYWEPSVGVQLKLINTGKGKTLWQVAREWDAGSPRTKRQIEQYYEENRERGECRFGPDIFVVSPKHFLLFVSNCIARDMLDNI